MRTPYHVDFFKDLVFPASRPTRSRRIPLKFSISVVSISSTNGGPAEYLVSFVYYFSAFSDFDGLTIVHIGLWIICWKNGGVVIVSIGE